MVMVGGWVWVGDVVRELMFSYEVRTGILEWNGVGVNVGG